MSTIKTGTTLTTAYQVVGDTTGAFVVQTGSTPTTAMTIDTSQNVGIGTSSPATPLDVNGRIRTRGGTNFLDAYHNATIGVLETTGGASTPLVLATAGTERMRIDISGNVGIGTNAPAYPLDIVGAQIRQSSSSSLGTRMTFVSTSTNGRTYQIGSNFVGGVGEFSVYDATAATERARIDINGNLLIRTANAGIVFNKTGALTNSTLNDYEEGTWTPNVGGNATYSGQVGIYTKIGRMVTVQCDMVINLIGTGATGLVYGLPFPCSGGNYYAANISYFSGLSKTVFSVMGIVPIASNPYVYFETVSNTAGQSTANDSQSIFQNGSRVIFTATYFTA